jgi:hypothetical protein
VTLTTHSVPRPALPGEIVKAASERRLVIFLGAGISCAAGLPSWNSLKDELIMEMRLYADEDDGVRSQLREMNFYKCFQAVSLRDRTIYDKIIKKSLKLSGGGINLSRFQQLIKSLKSLKPVSFVTTNVDDLLYDCRGFNTGQFRKKEQCYAHEIPEDKVFCLHGSAEQNIFKNDDLNELYQRSTFQNFLSTLFSTYNVLFVGFSFRDDELLKHAELPPLPERGTDNLIRHFALLSSDHTKPPPLELSTFYGIKALPYENADGKHDNFPSTILSWERMTASPTISGTTI